MESISHCLFSSADYADLRRFTQIYADFRPAIFAEIRYSRIFRDSFWGVRNNETNKGRRNKKYKKLFSKPFLK
jgi:hypothetical protein